MVCILFKKNRKEKRFIFDFMSLEDKELMQFKVGKKEQYAARMAFFIPGFAISTWAPMIPMIKERLHIEADILGLLLLCIGISAFIVIPIGGILGKKFGCKKVMMTTGCIFAVALVALSCLPNIWSYAICLVLVGAIMGCTEVCMNINAVVVEKLSQKRMMSSMHGFWSVGCFCSAGLFSILAKIGLDVFFIAIIHCLIILAIVFIFGRYFLDYKSASSESAIAIPKGIVILFGILAGVSFLGEGAVMDWGGVFLTEAKDVELSLAGIGYAVFSVAMLIMRLIGDKIVQFLGEEKAVVLGSSLAGIGFLWIIIIDNFYLMLFGFVLLGLGAANIVPVLYSLLQYQKDMPINAAVTAVTCMGYTGVILGPAILGFIAQGIGIVSVFYLLMILFIMQVVVSKYVFSKLK